MSYRSRTPRHPFRNPLRRLRQRALLVGQPPRLRSRLPADRQVRGFPRARHGRTGEAEAGPGWRFLPGRRLLRHGVQRRQEPDHRAGIANPRHSGMRRACGAGPEFILTGGGYGFRARPRSRGRPGMTAEQRTTKMTDGLRKGLTTYSDYNPCHGNVPQIIEAVKRGVMLSGAMPMVFPTISIAESFAYPTSMYLRNLMAMDTEEMIRAQPMDAVIVIGGCDKTLPAQIMAAVSADLPTVVIPVGPMVVGHHKGEVLGACTDCRRLWAKYRAGEIDDTEIEAVNGRLAPSVGTCMVMGTASTMACITEALGLSLPMSATIPAPHAERFRSAEASGRVAAAMAKAKGPRPSELLTKSAFRNAQVVLQAIGGSTNGLIHLTAIANRTPHRIDLDAFDKIGREVPVLIDLKPSGEHYMEHFHRAGGLPKLMAQLGDLIDLDAKTITGETLREVVAKAEDVPGQDAIRPRDNPIKPEGGLAVLHGNLAPRGD